MSFTFSLKRTMDIVVGGKVVCVCGYGEVRNCIAYICTPLYMYIQYVYVCIYSGTSLIWTPLGQTSVSLIERCP